MFAGLDVRVGPPVFELIFPILEGQNRGRLGGSLANSGVLIGKVRSLGEVFFNFPGTLDRKAPGLGLKLGLVLNELMKLAGV